MTQRTDFLDRVTELVCEPGPVDDAVVQMTSRALIDTYAVGAAACAAGSEGPQILMDTLSPLPSGPADIIGYGQSTNPFAAAMVNGALTHTLDLDDVSMAMNGHPSVVLLPALLALAAEMPTSGATLTRAYAIGIQTAAALWSAHGPVHPARGWHDTATVGTVAAAAACAHLVGANREVSQTALGIAASFAAGSRANFGTMTKALHAGNAAAWGLNAARLAARGFTANAEQLIAPFGYLDLFGDADIEAALAVLDGPWAMRGTQGLSIKAYPCCYLAHRAIDAAIELHDRTRSATPRSIHVVTSPGVMRFLTFDEPRTELAAKFNGPHLIAAAFERGTVDFDALTPEAIASPTLTALRSRVRWEESATPPLGAAEWHEGYAVVSVTDDAGTRSVRVDVPTGAPERPLSDAGLRAKFDGCVLPMMAAAQADRQFAHLSEMVHSPRVGGWSAV